MATSDGNDDAAVIMGDELWRHPDPKSTSMYKFLLALNEKYSLHLETYDDLYQWTIDHVSAFWEEVWHFTNVVSSAPFEKALVDTSTMFPRPAFFAGAKLNFAENLLYPRTNPPIDASSPAVIAVTESTREFVSWSELRRRVLDCQRLLKSEGINIQVGDRVAAYVGNHTNALVILLAAIGLGAIWSAISPDSGSAMVLDRLKQIGPKVLFADDGQFYNGKRHSVLAKVKEIANGLESLSAVVVMDVVGEDPAEVRNIYGGSATRKIILFGEWLENAKAVNGVRSDQDRPEFIQGEPDAPVYILYSSGTTGAPKCIVHGAIGTLIQHKKEHQLHCSVEPGDKLFYFTTTSWMMHHWLVSALASGATLVLYDGSPMRYRSSDSQSSPDDLAMARLISELRIDHFGTSAKYLSLLEQKNVLPKAEPDIDLACLRAIYSTASPLAPSTFKYIYRAFPALNVGSITGGTDIVSLFGAPCPLTPVYAGEVQVRGLGMAVVAYDSDAVEPKEVTDGDLVCIRPFPSQPVAFWGPDGHERYEKSYFTRFGRQVWHHGDYISINPKTKGLEMKGRSDGTLKPSGVRFGSAEIYNVLLNRFSSEVADGLCIGRRRPDESDETVVLFVKMEEGVEFTEEFATRLKRKIRDDLSARHVPTVVDECFAIPFTVNGKKIEGAVKQILSGSKVKTGASVANPECLEFYKAWAENH